MKVYAQFYVMSCGLNGTEKKPVTMLGTDGVAILDGRKNYHSLHEDVKNIVQKHLKKNDIVGWKIIRARSFTETGKVIFSYTVNQDTFR
jgi:(2Fe-2S) ferredoxin